VKGQRPLRGQGAEPLAGVSLSGQRARVEGAAPRWGLGASIKRENKGLTITQSHCIEKILKKFNCKGCGPISTPMEACIKLVPHMGNLLINLNIQGLLDT
nr:zinc finger, CCHC-type [Tanacetum cinerariifolium]